MQGLKRVLRVFRWAGGGGGLLVLALGLALAPGCKDHQLSGQELQARKVETLRQNQGKLTGEEEYQISTIHARTDAEYDRSVERILAGRKTGSGGGSGTGNSKKD